MKRHKKQSALSLLLAAALLCTSCGGSNTEQQKPPVIDDNYRNYYEIFVRSFSDGDGNGLGDFNGITQKLDYIRDTGFTGLWLMPIFSSDTYHKYDTKDYYTIDPSYGTLEDFKTLLAQCEQRDIDVILDLVFNHTSSKHPWFLEACDYISGLEEGELPDANECKYVDYYNFTTEYSAGYTRVPGTSWYYESVFWSEMPDLNLYNEQVREEIEAIASYWMDLGVKGFRLDAAKEYVSGNTTANVEILSWFVDFMDENYPDNYLVAEVWDTKETIQEFYKSGIDSIFNYPFGNHSGRVVSTLKFAGNDKSGYTFASTLEQTEADFKANNPDFIDAPFLSNHDTGRVAGFLAPDEAKIKLAGALNQLMSGCSFVYYGEEIGMKGAGKDENKRAPMNWGDDANAVRVTPPNMDDVKQYYPTAKEQMEDPDSIYSYYKAILNLRNKYPAIARGTQTAISLDDQNIIVIKKDYNDETLYILVNNNENATELDLSQTPLKDLTLADSLAVLPETDKDAIQQKKNSLSISGYGVCIMK